MRWSKMGAALCLALLGAQSGAEAEDSARDDGTWRFAPVSAAEAEALFADQRAPAPDGLPDGRIAERIGGDLVAAWYAAPTRRYGHAVIGDGIEGGALIARTAEGAELRFDLPEDEVFEDVTPRLADLDGDGRVEIVAIRASLRAGAAVTVYGLEAGALVEKATTPFIGRRNRWLNIAAIAPFTGGAGREIAYVETPHIGGVLRLLAYRDGALVELTARRGFSNHAIGAYELRLAAAADLDGDGRIDLATPDQSRRVLKLVTYDGVAWREIGALDAPLGLEIVLTAPSGPHQGRVAARFRDGSAAIVTGGR